MTQRSLDLYKDELARRERALDRRQAQLERLQADAERDRDTARSRAAGLEDELAACVEELERVHADRVACERQVEALREELRTAQESREAALISRDAAQATADRLVHEIATTLPKEVAGPHRELWVRRLEMLSRHVGVEADAAPAALAAHPAFELAVAGMLVRYGMAATRRAIERSTDVEELADHVRPRRPPPRDTAGPADPRSTRAVTGTQDRSSFGRRYPGGGLPSDRPRPR